MQMQPGCTTLWAQGQRGSTSPTAARIIAADEPRLETVPDIVDVPRCRMTRHAGDGDSFAHSCRSWGIPPGRPRAVTPARAEGGGFPLLTCISGSIRILAFLVATGYKMPLSGGFLLRATGPVRVQNVPFAGVFVPQVWNQHADQSASRPCPVGVWLRLYYAVPASLSRFVSPCKLLYTSPTSPKNPKFLCTEGRRLQGPPSGTLHPGLQSARLDDGQDDTVPFPKKAAYRCAECIGVPRTPHRSLPDRA